jgi:radical SAM superfamily enzyme YgiQ (UPF0313 family)
MQMKILMCSVPDGPLSNTLRSLFPYGNAGRYKPQAPFGILRVLSWMEKNGYDSDIYDIGNLRPSDETLIKNFKRTNPTVVGLSAPLSHCYPNVKRIIKILRELFPDIWIVVGGHLTGSSNVILRKTEADICVVGDGEIPFVKLLDYFKLHPTRRQLDHTGLHQIKGLAFIDENNKLKVTGNAEQLSASEMKYPDYDRLKAGLQKYGGDGELIHKFFYPIDNVAEYTVAGFDNFMRRADKYPKISKFYKKNMNKKIATIFTSMGCVARCTFCQRAAKGYVTYAPNDLESHIIDLKEKYNVGGVLLMDQNFGSNRKQGYEFAQLMKKHDFFWFPIGVRVVSTSYEDLKFYYEHNMLAIRYGFENGSQQMLDIMEKKYTKEDVYNVISNCKKVGISTVPVGLLFGMPGETEETIKESAAFTASLWYLMGYDWNTFYNPTWVIAIPGTPLYEYCQQIGVIGKTLDEEEDYLIYTSEFNNTYILRYINKTNASNKEVHYWHYLHRYAAKKAYRDLIIKNNKSIKNRLLQIYEQCIKESFKRLIYDINIGRKYRKNLKLILKIEWYTLISVKFLLSLSITFMPKAVLFPVIRVCANIRFFYLNIINKAEKGSKKSYLFDNRRVNSIDDLRISENRIAKTNRPIERSLRTVVMDNRKQMKPAITDEEIGLQILAQGQ